MVLYKQQDEVEAVQKLAPNGVNVFWETLREPDFDRIVAVLAAGAGATALTRWSRSRASRRIRH